MFSLVFFENVPQKALIHYCETISLISLTNFPKKLDSPQIQELHPKLSLANQNIQHYSTIGIILLRQLIDFHSLLD